MNETHLTFRVRSCEPAGVTMSRNKNFVSGATATAQCEWPGCTASQGLTGLQGALGRQHKHCGEHHVLVQRLLRRQGVAV